MRISKEDLNTIGDHSISGQLLMAGELPNDEKVIHLDFEQFSDI